MVGDYISTSFSGSTAYPAFALASAPSGSTFHQAVHTIGVEIAGGTVTATESPVAQGQGETRRPAPMQTAR